MRRTLLAAVLLAAPAAVLAEGLSYTFVDARYFSTDSDAVTVNQQGGSLAGSFALNEQFFVTADASYGETDDIAASATTSGSFQTLAGSLRLGAHHPITPVLDIVANGGVLAAEVKGKGAFNGSDSDVGYLAELGMRLALVGPVEVGAFYAYQDIFDDNSSGFTGDLQYHVTSHFSAVFSANFSRGTDVYSFGARYRF